MYISPRGTGSYVRPDVILYSSKNRTITSEQQISSVDLRSSQRHIMCTVFIGLFLTCCGALMVLGNLAVVEILRYPSKVAIFKPVPYPIVYGYDDENIVNEVKSSNVGIIAKIKVGLNSTEVGLNSTEVGLNSTEVGLNSTEVGLNSTEVGLNSTEVGLNSTGLVVPISNTTCIRIDYENQAAAIFMESVGSIDDAYLIFNSSYESPFSKALGTSDVAKLKVLNETVVDCSLYEVGVLDIKGLSHGALCSLLGCG